MWYHWSCPDWTGNATLAGLPANLLSQLHAGARLIFNANRREHVTPLLRFTASLASRPGTDHFQTGDTDVPMRQLDCSWLPISRRETSRRCTRPQTPTLSSIIFTCHSSYLMFLAIAPSPSQAASVWNKLPQEIRSATSLPVFRRRLKTHLFRLRLTLVIEVVIM